MSARSRYALALVILGIACYWRALGTDFIGDDDSRIVLFEKYLQSGYAASIRTILPDRPLLVASILLNYQLDGLDPRGYKALSLILHAAVGVVFFALLAAIQKRHFPSPPRLLLPALLAAAFIAHPLNSQALLSSIQRGTIMAALGGIGSLLCFFDYLSTRRRSLLLLSLLWFTLGILSKPFIVFLPVVMILYLWFTGERIRSFLPALLPFFAVALLPALPYLVIGANSQQFPETLPWPDYLLVQTRVLWLYLKLMFAPTNLRFFYEIDPDPRLFANFTWLAILGHLLILGAGVRLFSRRKLVAFGIFSTYLAFLPESGVFPIRHVAFEHRAYYPLLFFLLTLFALVRAAPRVEKIAAALLVPAVAVGVWMTTVRIDEIGTHEKWSINTYRYQTPTRANNLALLNLLSYDGSLASGRKFSEDMEKADPSFPPYQLFRRLFSFPGDQPDRQRETLRMVADALRTPGSYLLDDTSTANSLLLFYLAAPQTKALEPISFSLSLEPLIRNFLPGFLDAPEEFGSLILLHQRALALLRRHYESRLEAGDLPETDFVQYLNVLGQQFLYEPEAGDALVEGTDRLTRRYPERAGLIDACWAYYRGVHDRRQRRSGS